MEGSGELQCVGKLEIAQPKPVGFLCGSLPVPTDSASSLVFQSALASPSDTIGAPRYRMLPAETDLNTPPAAARSSEELQWETGPISQDLSRKCEALAISGLTEYGNEIDVVAPTDILKQIFKIPYSKAQVSIAVQRIGDTLILNTGPDIEEGEKMCRRQSNKTKGSNSSILLNFAKHSVRAEACDCPPTCQPSPEKQASSTILPGQFDNRQGSFVSSSNSSVGKSQFLDHNANGSQNSTQRNHDKFFWGAKQNKGKNRRRDSLRKTSEIGEKSRCPVQEPDKLKGNNGFLRILFWQFHNFRMLLGSDLLLFSNEKYVAVSLHLWDVARQVTPVTWLEAWLDNVMASVPELAVCYHQDGVVQGYELLKTDDIFLLKGISEDGSPAFHPQVVQKIGLSVLRFLQDNCKQDPGAYWLYKGAGDDVIQLYDLLVIPKNHSSDNHDESRSSLPSHMHKGRRDSLFSLGTLLYRVAHRLSLSTAADNRAKCAKFFKKCLDFLREQDHLIVRAYAHEQLARLILKCYVELELTSEPLLLESEVTVTDLEDECSEFSLGMFGPTAQEKGFSQAVECGPAAEDKASSQNSDDLTLEVDSCFARNSSTSVVTEVGDITESTAQFKSHDDLVMSQVSISSPRVIKTVADPISSKLAAVHHVSQAIKSLRCKRQLQNTQENPTENGNRIHERSSTFNFSGCACGDASCIEVCDIREWLPKSKMDHKMWNLVLLLGESYLALGEAYIEDNQLQRALRVVELACLVYGSMPQHLEDARFISSMVGSSSCHLKLEGFSKKTNLAINCGKDVNDNYFEQAYLTEDCSPICLFWIKAWTLVGDIHVEYHRTRGKDIPKEIEKKSSLSELRMSNEVVREVKRLKKKLGQCKHNCSTCSLINCSCQSDRASSGNSASSSSGHASSYYGRKQSRKLHTKGSSKSFSGHTPDDNRLSKVDFENHYLQNNNDISMHTITNDIQKLKERSTVVSRSEHDNTAEIDFNESDYSEPVSSGPCNKEKSEVKYGGIFKFLQGPKSRDIEFNLLAAIDCYDSAKKAMVGYPIGSAEVHSVVRKKGWVCNELGRYRLENTGLGSAEIAFADAIEAFKEVSDHANIILINCNLGHGRRALAEELVSKIDMVRKHDLSQKAYKQAMVAAKLEYLESLKYYAAAKTELISADDTIDSLLRNEVHTQYAHTYLRLGMLLAREGILPEGGESGQIDELPTKGRTKEEIENGISANDAYREALATYESLGDLRRQEAAFAHFQLACYHKDICLKLLDSDQKHLKLSKIENKRQKMKWHASLAEKNWQKSLDFYGPKTHPVMYLNILLEQSALSLSLSNIFHSNVILEGALTHLLDGRHVVEENGGCSFDLDTAIIAKFWNQLQTLLKYMLSSCLSGSSNKTGVALQTRIAGKLKEMYRISLKSTGLDQLYAMNMLWVS